MGSDAVFDVVKEILINEFKIAPESIGIDKCIDEDLELDSLDMVDLLICLKNHIGDKVNPALFKDARTVRDVVNLLLPLWKC